MRQKKITTVSLLFMINFSVLSYFMALRGTMIVIDIHTISYEAKKLLHLLMPELNKNPAPFDRRVTNI